MIRNGAEKDMESFFNKVEVVSMFVLEKCVERQLKKEETEGCERHYRRSGDKFASWPSPQSRSVKLTRKGKPAAEVVCEFGKVGKAVLAIPGGVVVALVGGRRAQEMVQI